MSLLIRHKTNIYYENGTYNPFKRAHRPHLQKHLTVTSQTVSNQVKTP